VVIRNYFSATVYAWPSLEPKATFTLPDQPQGEGIAVTAGGTVYLSSEGLHSKVLRDPLPANVERSLVPVEKSPSSGKADFSTREGDSSTPTSDSSDGRGWWPWLLGGIAGLGVIGVLLRSLRPR
jgi:hypothetical protein